MSFTILISLFLLVALTVISVVAVVYGIRMIRGRNRRRMFAPLFGTLCNGIGHTGISVICTDMDNPDAVADLLTVEYERYEVIIVLDSAHNPALLRELTDIYALVSVDYSRSDDFAPSVCVRRLFRSRRRRFRRLTVLDTVGVSPETDADAAADIAVYDYIAVVGGDITLLPCAIERIVAEICSSAEPPHEIRTEAGAELTVRLRDDVAAEGGFASGARHFCPPSQRRQIYETLAVSHRRTSGVVVVAVGTVIFTATTAVFSFYTRELFPIAAVMLTLAVVLSSILLSAPCVSPHLKGKEAFVGSVCNFCEKLLLKISQ